MLRRFPDLNGTFDVLVIGGGIYGAWTAYDAALRGLRVALIERTDWGAGSSSASSKLIHGGLRYLEHGHLALVRRTLAERARLMRLGPHRVRPLRFLLPLHAGLRRPAWQLGLGLTVYDWLAGARGAEAHQRLDGAELTTRAPWLAAAGLRGGFVYLDAQEDDARMVLEVVDGALIAGAVAVNHAVAESLLRDADGRVSGALVRDHLAGDAVEVRARLTINAAGAWANGLLPPATRQPVRLTAGTHLVLPAAPGERAAALLTHPRDGRVFFLLPWYGRSLVGTTDTDHAGDPDTTAPNEADADYLLAGLAARCPALGWTRRDVVASFAGLRVLVGTTSGAASSASREWRLAEPLPGLLQPVGGKFTSARAEAALIVDRVLAGLGRAAGRSPTETRPLPWAPLEPWDAWLAEQVAAGGRLGLATDIATALAERHGRRVSELHRRIAADPAAGERLAPGLPFVRAELAQAREREMACNEEDVRRRRVPLAILAPAAT